MEKKSSTCSIYEIIDQDPQLDIIFLRTMRQKTSSLEDKKGKDTQMGPHRGPEPLRGPPPGDKKKVSGVKSDILIKYKRIKWTPSRKALLLLPVG